MGDSMKNNLLQASDSYNLQDWIDYLPSRYVPPGPSGRAFPMSKAEHDFHAQNTLNRAGSAAIAAPIALGAAGIGAYPVAGGMAGLAAKQAYGSYRSGVNMMDGRRSRDAFENEYANTPDRNPPFDEYASREAVNALLDFLTLGGLK